MSLLNTHALASRAEARPIYREITHHVPLDFPLLLGAPALAINLTWRRVRAWPTARAVAALRSGFLIALLSVQWTFASFLMAHGLRWSSSGTVSRAERERERERERSFK